MAKALPTVHIGKSDVQCAIDQGIWQIVWPKTLVPTSIGRADVSLLVASPELGGSMTLAKPVNRVVVEITGITDASELLGPNTKVATYMWRWDPSTYTKDYSASFVKCFPTPGGTDPVAAQAYLKLYDDGWRVAHLN